MVKTKQKSNSTFAVLDAGTSKIAAIIAETNKNGDLIVIGDAIQESSGLRGGEINNLEAFSTAIGNTVQMAEEKAGITVQEVHLVCNAGQPKIQIARSNIDLSDAKISKRDLRRIVSKQNDIKTEDHRCVIRSDHFQYILDEQSQVQNPLGMFAQKLSSDTLLLTMRSTSLANMKQVLLQNHLNPGHIHHGASMSGFACLSEEEMDLGALVLDIGGGTSSVALFMEGNVIYTHTMPIGGIQITRDIATVLSISAEEAERLKVFEGTVFMPETPETKSKTLISGIPSKGDNFIFSGNFSETDTIKLSNSEQIERHLLNSIIKTRLEEILEKLMEKLIQANMQYAAGNRVILVGGSAKLTGISEFVSAIWGKNARLGVPNHIDGLANRENIDPLSSAIGMAKFIQSNPKIVSIKDQTRILPFGKFGKIGNWLINNI